LGRHGHYRRAAGGRHVGEHVQLGYGWYQISGNAVVNISGTVAAGDSAYFNATAQLKSAAVAGKQVLNATAASANGVPSTGFAVYTIQRPFAQGAIT
jgi:hypothetical protein